MWGGGGGGGLPPRLPQPLSLRGSCCDKHNIDLSPKNKRKIFQIFKEIDKILPQVNKERKRMMNVKIVLKQLFKMLKLPHYVLFAYDAFFFWLVLWWGICVEVDVDRITILPTKTLRIFSPAHNFFFNTSRWYIWNQRAPKAGFGAV